MTNRNPGKTAPNAKTYRKFISKNTKIYGRRANFIRAVFGFKRIWRACILHLRGVYLAGFGAVFIKFGADAIFGFTARNIAVTFGVLLAVFAVLALIKITNL